ncbi:MAG: MFS transporter [Actinomycetales bacterium]|nr:MFS transporter [Actinomycetales bacterium]
MAAAPPPPAPPPDASFSPATGTARTGRIAALLGIVLVALTLRTAVGAFSPIVEQIGVDIDLGPLLIGAIGALPPVVFAVSSLLAPRLARFGLERGVAVMTLVAAAGHAIRAIAPDGAVLLLGTLLALAGAGVGNVLLPPLVKRWFPGRIPAITALYVTVMSLGATAPPLFAVPIADAAGWRLALGVWALLPLAAAAPWIVELVGRRGLEPRDVAAREAVEEPSGRLAVVRSPLAWAMALLFGATTVGAYAVFAWLPLMLRDLAGVGEAEAGAMLALFAILGFPQAIAVPLLASRVGRQAPLVVLGMLCFTGGWLGLLLAPRAAPVLWTVLIGLGPLIFPLALSLINLRSRTHAGSVATSAFVQGIGYTLGAAGPLVVGVLHQLTGGWTAALILLIAIVVLDVPAVVLLSRPGVVEDDPGVLRGAGGKGSS